MKILQLCNKIPYPEKDGYSLAVLNLSRTLKKYGSNVQILAMNTRKQKIEDRFINNSPIKIYSVKISNNINIINAIWYLLQNKSYNIYRFISKEYNKKLIKLLEREKFDLIQLEGLYLTPYLKTIRKHSTAKIILRSHNIEHKIWSDLAKNESCIFKKIYLKILQNQLKKYEIKKINKYDGIIAISKIDKDIYIKHNCKIPLTNIPTSLNKIKRSSTFIEKNSIFFIGSLDWRPNVEGIKWFLNNVWKLVIKKKPEAKFYIAGRNTPKWLYKTKINNIKIIGEVENAHDFIKSKEIMVSPLFSGSGIRIKLLESMMLEKPIVSTSKSANGIDVKHNENILIANTPMKFADAILKYLNNQYFKDEITNNAIKLMKKNYNEKSIIKKINLFYNSVL